MDFALAHETLYPHVHPHAHFPFVLDVFFTFVFSAALVLAGKALIRAYRHSIRGKIATKQEVL